MAADQVQEILVRLEGISTKLDTALGIQADHEERLRCLEGKPGKRWDGLVGQIISVVAAAVVGGVVGYIFGK